jgi:hypothetical protein
MYKLSFTCNDDFKEIPNFPDLQICYGMLLAKNVYPYQRCYSIRSGSVADLNGFYRVLIVTDVVSLARSSLSRFNTAEPGF